MNVPKTIDDCVERDIAELRSDFMQVGDTYIDPPLAKKEEQEQGSHRGN